MHLLKGRQPYQPVINTNTLIVSAIFTALIIIFTHIIAIQTPFVRISFSFLPIALFAMLYGPLSGGMIAAIADLLGCLLFSPGLYFPGFTLSAFISGMIYGYFLHNKKITILNLSLASVVILLAVDLALNTLWLSLLYHKAASAFLAGRLIKCIVLLPVQIAAIYAVCKPLLRYRVARPQ